MNKIIGLVFLGLIFSIAGLAQSGRSQTRTLSTKAGALFDFAIFYGQNEGSSEPGNLNLSKTNESYYDMKLGYIFNSGIYFGAEYSTRNSGYLNGSTTGNAAAAGLGYFFNNGCNLRAYYRFNESFSDFRNGTGVQIDGGYSQMVATNFYLGVLLSYRKTAYTKRDSDPTITKYTYDSTYPMLTFGFLIN